MFFNTVSGFLFRNDICTKYIRISEKKKVVVLGHFLTFPTGTRLANFCDFGHFGELTIISRSLHLFQYGKQLFVQKGYLNKIYKNKREKKSCRFGSFFEILHRYAADELL